MPGFTTHYLFGLNTYQSLEYMRLKKVLREHHGVYSLGLQGPDVFFYFLPCYLVHSDNIGSIAHEKCTGTFLHYLLESRKLFPDYEERQIAEAYIAGFLGHYLLDAHCHPYIYWKSRFEEKNARYHGAHMRLESDIDTELLLFYKHKLPSEFHPESTIAMTVSQCRTIAAILHYVYAKTYPELGIHYATMHCAIRSMQLGVRALRDSSGRKKVLIRKLESMILGYPLLSSMIPSDHLRFSFDPLNVLHREWHNPWDKSLTSRDSLFDLMEDAQERYVSALVQLDEIFSDGVHPEKESEKTDRLLRGLGNKSYHSGLETVLG